MIDVYLGAKYITAYSFYILTEVCAILEIFLSNFLTRKSVSKFVFRLLYILLFKGCSFNQGSFNLHCHKFNKEEHSFRKYVHEKKFKIWDFFNVRDFFARAEVIEACPGQSFHLAEKYIFLVYKSIL